MNKINVRQNEENILALLYSQRKIYNKVEYISFLEWGIDIFIPVLTYYILPILLKKNQLWEYGVLIILFFILKYCDHFIKKNTILGANLKQYIDNYIYTDNICNIDDLSKDKIVEEIDKRKKGKDYNIQITNNGMQYPPGVRDWYTGIDENMQNKIAIFYCQKENSWWDQKLLIKYDKIFKILLIILMIFTFYLLKLKSLQDTFKYILTFLPLMYKIYMTYENIQKIKCIHLQIDILKKIGEINLNKNILIEIQKLLYERRKIHFYPPLNLLHRHLSKKLHKLYKRILNFTN